MSRALQWSNQIYCQPNDVAPISIALARQPNCCPSLCGIATENVKRCIVNSRIHISVTTFSVHSSYLYHWDCFKLLLYKGLYAKCNFCILNKNMFEIYCIFIIWGVCLCVRVCICLGLSQHRLPNLSTFFILIFFCQTKMLFLEEIS